MTHTPLDKIHVEATNLILKQRGEIKRLEAEKADLLGALDKTAGRIDNLLDSAHFNDTVRNFLMNMGDDIQAAIAKARP